jgi:hypothetical protein
MKFKKDKVSLPRPSSARVIDHLDEKQQHRKNQQSTNGSMRPARVNIFFKYLEKTSFFFID